MIKRLKYLDLLLLNYQLEKLNLKHTHTTTVLILIQDQLKTKRQYHLKSAANAD